MFSKVFLREIKKTIQYVRYDTFYLCYRCQACGSFMHLALSQFCELHFPRFSRFFKREKCLCYHCGESMRKEHALMATFQQQPYPVCCHGCLAVLNAIEKNNLVDEYLRSKRYGEEGKSFV